MGLTVEDIFTLIELKMAGHILRGGAVLDLGSQRISNHVLAERTKVMELATLFEVTAPCPLPLPQSRSDGRSPLNAELPMAELLWRWLGYDYAAVDIDGTPGCIPLDLNYDSVPTCQQAKYHIVTNFGTTEHVANQFNAFKVIHELTIPGGVMIHNVPAQGMLTHGLVNYTHKFFWMLARSNGYEVLKLSFVIDPRPYSLPTEILEDSAIWRRGRGPPPHLLAPPPDHWHTSRPESHLEMDCALRVVLKKSFDIPFVAPIDVNTGTRTENPALSERYWTVFRPDPFVGLQPHHRPISRRSE
jgi:hypothetical protein